MITASQLAGFCAAHAIWGLSESGTLITTYACTTEDDERKMERLIGSEAGEAIASGRERLAGNPMDANDAILLYGGHLTQGAEEVPAVIIEMRAYFSPGSEAVVGVPYSPGESGRFLVRQPILLEWKNCEDFDKDWALEAFFEGVDQHEQGSKAWREALDPSR